MIIILSLNKVNIIFKKRKHKKDILLFKDSNNISFPIAYLTEKNNINCLNDEFGSNEKLLIKYFVKHTIQHK